MKIKIITIVFATKMQTGTCATEALHFGCATQGEPVGLQTGLVGYKSNNENSPKGPRSF